jgi:two-component system nitrate/nitrite response regulator NarL
VEQDHPNSDKIRVLIVDGVRLVRDGLALLLLQSPNFAVVGFSQPKSGYEEQQEGRAADVMLVVAPWGVNASDAIQKIKDEFLGAKVVIIGVSGTEKEGLEYIEAGASGYVLPESCPEDLIETIQKVYRGEASCPPNVLSYLFERIASLRAQLNVGQDNLLNSLTQRELEVLQLVADGMSNKEIAIRLKLELQTVKNHLHNILEKLRVHNRREAVACTRKFGLAVNGN